MNRVFERTAIKVPNSRPQPAYLIRCSKCGETEKVTVTTQRGGVIAPEGIAAKFRNKGWSISSRGNSDLCPNCQVKRPKVAENTESNVVELVRAEPPREMGKDDRRVIFAKINDVYLDERSGYSRGWSDKRVAEDLGVPLAWVSQIRERDFGKETDEVTELFAETMTQAEILVEGVLMLRKNIHFVLKNAKEALSSLDDNSKKVESVCNELNAMLAQLKARGKNINKTAS